MSWSNSCGSGLWVMLLQVSWAWNISNISSKNALILHKKNPSSIPSCTPKIPLHFFSNTAPKMGFLGSDSRGVYLTVIVPNHGVGTREKNPISME
jgi:hypothetical protein